MKTRNQVIPVNVLKTLGISKEQYAQMGTREIMQIVRWYYTNQSKIVINKI